MTCRMTIHIDWINENWTVRQYIAQDASLKWSFKRDSLKVFGCLLICLQDGHVISRRYIVRKNFEITNKEVPTRSINFSLQMNKPYEKPPVYYLTENTLTVHIYHLVGKNGICRCLYPAIFDKIRHQSDK